VLGEGRARLFVDRLRPESSSPVVYAELSGAPHDLPGHGNYPWSYRMSTVSTVPYHHRRPQMTSDRRGTPLPHHQTKENQT
jgi:hypothetical protein